MLGKVTLTKVDKDDNVLNNERMDYAFNANLPDLDWLFWKAMNLRMSAVRKMRLVRRMYMFRKVSQRHTVLYLTWQKM
jgi:hypothetical protein